MTAPAGTASGAGSAPFGAGSSLSLNLIADNPVGSLGAAYNPVAHALSASPVTPGGPPSAWPLAEPQGFTVNGRGLDEFSALVESFAPLAQVPARRGNNLAMPHRHGEIRVPRKLIGAGVFVLSILVRGCQPDGTIPAGSSERAELEARIQEIIGLFTAQETATLVRTMGDGTTLTCDVEVTAAIPVTRDYSQVPTIATVAVACLNPAAFWFETNEQVSVITAPDDTPVPLWEFSGSTAPLDDLTYVIGPSWNPVLTDGGGTGTWLAYDAVIPNGQALVYDGATQQVSGGGRLVVDQGKVRRGRRLTLAPVSPPSLSVSSSGPNPVNVQVSGRRAFLTA